MGKALDLLSKLEVKEFTWKHDNRKDLGLIAEEVEKVIPEAVHYNDAGQVEGLKPLTLLGVVIEAIKELKEE